MSTSTIEWTEATWNPVTGCDRVSAGCDHCYALTLAKRLKAMGQAHYQNDGDPRTSGPGFGLTTHADALDIPLHWRKPRKVFVNSMSDLFHPDVPVEFLVDVWDTMAAVPQHTFQILTKRPQRMAQEMSRWSVGGNFTNDDGLLDCVSTPADATQYDGSSLTGQPWPLPNVWLGTSVENQRYADLRIPHLLATPAAVRFLSIEPLLGPVNIQPWLPPNPLIANIDWVIVGGESGPGARPMHPDWVRSIRDQCVEAGVPYFFKQWGEWTPSDQCGIRNYKLSKLRFRYESRRFSPDGTPYDPVGKQHPTEPGGYAAPGMESLLRVGKKAAGRELDGRTWDEMPGGATP